MIAILETHDPVRLNFLSAVLEDAGLHPLVLGGASPYPASFPSRLMVPEAEVELARLIMAEAEREL